MPDSHPTSTLRALLLKLTVVMVLGTAAVTTGAVSIVAAFQANQYQTLVARLDRNAELTASGTRVLTCVLSIDSRKHLKTQVHECLTKNGFPVEGP